MTLTGLRTIEAIRADIQDIRQQEGEALLYIQGKGRDEKDEYVLLIPGTLKPIYKYLKSRGAAKKDAPLFASFSDRNSGGRLTTRTLRRIIKDRLRAIGIDSDRLTAHSLRHTGITLALQAGATVQEVQALARHANINTTLIYAHNIDRIKQAPERKMEALISGNIGNIDNSENTVLPKKAGLPHDKMTKQEKRTDYDKVKSELNGMCLGEATMFIGETYVERDNETIYIVDGYTYKRIPEIIARVCRAMFVEKEARPGYYDNY